MLSQALQISGIDLAFSDVAEVRPDKKVAFIKYYQYRHLCAYDPWTLTVSFFRSNFDPECVVLAIIYNDVDPAEYKCRDHCLFAEIYELCT